jgi:hypothetical protein
MDIIFILIHKHDCRLGYCCKSLADFFQAIAAITYRFHASADAAITCRLHASTDF